MVKATLGWNQVDKTDEAATEGTNKAVGTVIEADMAASSGAIVVVGKGTVFVEEDVLA